MFSHLELIYRRAREQVPVNRNALDHFFSNFFFDDPLHRLGDEFQIALIGNLEFNFVPNVGKKRPGIIPNDFIEHLFIREPDDPAAGMVAGNVLTAKFPERGIEITDVDHVASGIANFNAITNAKRLPNKNKNPGDETFHRGLHGQADDDRTDAERGERAVPIHKHD